MKGIVFYNVLMELPANFAKFYLLEASHWICPHKRKGIRGGDAEMTNTGSPFRSCL